MRIREAYQSIPRNSKDFKDVILNGDRFVQHSASLHISGKSGSEIQMSPQSRQELLDRAKKRRAIMTFVDGGYHLAVGEHERWEITKRTNEYRQDPSMSKKQVLESHVSGAFKKRALHEAHPMSSDVHRSLMNAQMHLKAALDDIGKFRAGKEQHDRDRQLKR